MDEATASIDYATDTKIQKTIRGLGCTTITIAHRLQTVVDYDKVLVLEGGVVKEFGHPWELLGEKGGVFRGMCESSGEFGALENTARKAWEGKEKVGILVDVSVDGEGE
jgi:ABC-type multidrug transport system fused ATPase/permease subunit